MKDFLISILLALALIGSVLGVGFLALYDLPRPPSKCACGIHIVPADLTVDI